MDETYSSISLPKPVMMHSSTNNNITSSSTLPILYPYPPYIIPFSSSSSSSHDNYQYHPLLPPENTTSAGFFGLHYDQFSQVNSSLLPPGPEGTMLNLGGASSNTILSSSGEYQQHHSYDTNNVTHPSLVSKDVKSPVVAVKKDRHSKIFTAQGLRDRRVRLSINVAREFFDLQDLLGFDKASKTLEWLFSKSRNAIKDLEESKCNNNSSTSFSSSSTSECDGVLEDNVDKRMKKMKEAAAMMAKTSRAKARARARERTKEKRCMMTSKRSSPQICSHLSLFNELEPADMNQEPGSTVLAEYNDSVALKRKLKAPSGSNFPEPTSNCCSHINIQFPSAISQNWDINGGVFTCPSICAITANMNLSSSGF